MNERRLKLLVDCLRAGMSFVLGSERRVEVPLIAWHRDGSVSRCA